MIVVGFDLNSTFLRMETKMVDHNGEIFIYVVNQSYINAPW